jgi:sugar isomerase, kpsF/gutQ family
VDSEAILTKAKEVLAIEIEGLEAIKNTLNGDFVKLVEACCQTLDSGAKIVISGIGKSGHIGSKIAATMASTGSPTIFMHSVEAMHGDLGMIQKDDLLITISYSGESDELVRVVVPAKRLGVRVAALTGNSNSTLAQLSDIHVATTVPREACPFNLAPTTSSTVQLAIGDALAMTLLALRKFTKEDFGRLHPAGAIGRAVTMRVGDAMRSGDRLATVTKDYNVKDTLLKMTACRSGSAIIVDGDGRPAGIFTDGDFRRRAGVPDILLKNIAEVMTPNPASIRSDALAIEVLRLVEVRKVDDIIVTDTDGKVVGVVDIQDLPGLKLM